MPPSQATRPWDLQNEAKRIASTVPTVLVLPESSRFVPHDDQERLRKEVGERAVVAMRGVGHSVHRDSTAKFVNFVERLTSGIRS